MKPINSITAYIHILIINKNMNGVIFFTAILSLLLFPIRITTGQTTVIAVRTSNEIIVGADSLVAIDNGPVSKICKIIQAKNMFFAFSGLPIIRNKNLIVFSAYDVATDLGNSNKPIPVKVDIFTKNIKTILANTLERIRQENIGTFNHFYRFRNSTILSVIIAASEEKVHSVYFIDFKITSAQDRPVEITPIDKVYDEKLTSFQKDVIVIGHYEEIFKPIAEDVRLGNFSDPVNKIREWIKIETIAQPDHVGLPIDIIRITPSNAEWIQHKPECQEIMNNPKH